MKHLTILIFSLISAGSLFAQADLNISDSNVVLGNVSLNFPLDPISFTGNFGIPDTIEGIEINGTYRKSTRSLFWPNNGIKCDLTENNRLEGLTLFLIDQKELGIKGNFKGSILFKGQEINLNVTIASLKEIGFKPSVVPEVLFMTINDWEIMAQFHPNNLQLETLGITSVRK